MAREAIFVCLFVEELISQKVFFFPWCGILQVRYLAVLLIDELFTRSKLFRALLVPKFEMFMLLTIGYRDDYPLPKPPDRAALLRTASMEYVEKWNDMFGVHYKQIRLGYNYLKNTLRLQFPNLRASAALAEQQRQEKEARTQVKRLLLTKGGWA